MFDAIAQNVNYFTATHAQENSARTVAVDAEELKEAKQKEATQKTRALPAQEKTAPDGRKKDSLELSREAIEIRELQARDQEVRSHEAAHASAGGAYAGAPSYSFERGPDGQSYAVGGEVSIDVSPIAGDPEATLQKAQQVRAAALAPAEPSGQDVKVAQRAQSLATEARAELAKQQTDRPVTADVGAEKVASNEDEAPPQDAANGPATAPVPSSENTLSKSASRLSYYA